MAEVESISVEEIDPTIAPAEFSVIERVLNVISDGASLTAVTVKVKVAESEPPFPSVTVRTRSPIVLVSLFKFSPGLKVRFSSSERVIVEPTDKTVPSDKVKVPPVGIDCTVTVRLSPSGSVGAPIPNEAGVSSVKEKVALAPILGALLLLVGGVGVDPPPPPPPQAARASIAKLLNKKPEGPFSLKAFLEFDSSFLRILIN